MALVDFSLDELIHISLIMSSELLTDKGTLESGEADNDPDYREILIRDIQLSQSILDKLNND